MIEGSEGRSGDEPESAQPGARRLVALLCAAEGLTLMSFATVPALLPVFIADWSLSNTQAGTLAGAYFGGYMASVTLLVALTDRRDARAIFLAGALLAGLAGLGFALLAEGFWSGLVFQILAGIGLAGCYMPGLKLISDRIGGPRQSRYISFYTATFGIGVALSYAIAGEVGAALGWRWAFVVTGVAAIGAALLVWRAIPAGGRPTHVPSTRLLDLRPVLRCRPAMAYVLGYAGHIWELFAVRGWMVAFLAWVAAREGGSPLIAATTAAALLNLVGLLSSVGGNELAMRFGRRRVLVAVMLASALTALAVGLGASLPYWAVLLLCIAYGAPLMADSAALTAGAVAAAPDGHRGATLAVHTTLGFGCGFLGSLAVGIVLDLAGGPSAGGWLAAFAVIGLGVVAGAAAVGLMGRDTSRETGRA